MTSSRLGTLQPSQGSEFVSPRRFPDTLTLGCLDLLDSWENLITRLLTAWIQWNPVFTFSLARKASFWSAGGPFSVFPSFPFPLPPPGITGYTGVHFHPFRTFKPSVAFYLHQKRGAPTEAFTPILSSPSRCDIAHGQTCYGKDRSVLTAPVREHVKFLTLLPNANPLRICHGHKTPALNCFSFVSTVIATMSLSYQFMLETETWCSRRVCNWPYRHVKPMSCPL